MMASENTLRLREPVVPAAVRVEHDLRAGLRRDERIAAKDAEAHAKLVARKKRRAAKITRRGAKYRKLVADADARG